MLPYWVMMARVFSHIFMWTVIIVIIIILTMKLRKKQVKKSN